jgi:hypothetical protein
MRRSNFVQVFSLVLVVGALGMGAVAGVYSNVAANKAPVAAPTAAVSPEPEVVQLAQAEGDSFASRLRSHRIRLSADGYLPGKINLVDNETGAIRVLRDIKVMFIQNGEVKATATPGEGGMFQAAGLQPGAYSLAAIGPEGYVAYGLEVLPPAAPGPVVPAAPAPAGETASINGFVETQPVYFQEVSSVLAIDSLAIPRRDFDAVIQLARSYIPAEILNAPSASDLPALASVGDSLDEPPPTDDAEPSSVLKHHEVAIGADGTLSGRTRRVHPQTGRPTRLRRLNVFLVQNNEVVSQAPVSENGTFTFTSVTPGTYSFVASGLEGFTAFSLRAVNSAAVSDDRAVTNELIVPVAFQGGPMYLLDGVLVSPQDLAAALKELLQQAGVDVAALEAANPAGAGGLGNPGNGFGGGGGAGGGGDGLLGALFGAALGAGVAALASDGDEIQRQTPTTPSPM